MEQYNNWKELLAASFNGFITTLSAYLPSLIGAVILILAGILTAWFCRWLILRVGQGLDQMIQKFSFGSQYLHLRWPVSRITAAIAYWLIILFFITAAAESLGLPGLAEWLGQLIIYLPSILAAIIIVWFGVIVGNVIREKVGAFAERNDLAHARELAAVTRFVIIALAIVIGLDQIGIRITIIEQIFVVITAAVTFALGLSFGLGAGPAMKNIIAVSNLKQRYSSGAQIRIEGIEGRILEFSRTSVIVETHNGVATIPGRLFQDKVSLLIETDNQDTDE